MSHISQILPAHHKHCDEQFAVAEEAAQSGNWALCGEECGRFVREMLAHFDAEENLLFPAFEAATGMSSGPTQVMRMEHGQMRELLGQLESAQLAKDAETFAGVAETLLILMQQHNMKEENILYPMCDQALGAQVEQLSSELTTRLEEASWPSHA
ncbi:MAG: hemerythrin domain-containing protein [Rhodocyclaceae bacterium]|nr:MAG: hemerythrin domain-containing protein [Rhodocyclaceae bacterium]